MPFPWFIVNMNKSVKSIILLVFICVFVLSLGVSITHAQTGLSWSMPQRIPGYENDTSNFKLITDRNGTVHAFSSQWLRNSTSALVRAIVYNQWSKDRGWTEAEDILMSPFKSEARLLDAYLDDTGIVHVIYFGGDSTEANVYYSEASLSNISNVQAWRKPVLIAERAQDPESGLFFQDDQKNFIVVFAGKASEPGLYRTVSKDRGLTWSKPELMVNIKTKGNSIYNLKLSQDAVGNCHIVWIEYNAQGQGRTVYYTALSREGSSVGEVQKLAESASGLGVMTPGIVAYDKDVFVVYNNTPTIYIRRSMDSGKTWGNPSALFPKFIGVNGTPSFVVDGSNQLYLFFAQRINLDQEIHGLWYSRWKDGTWTWPDPVVNGPLIVDKVGYRGFDPYDAQAVAVLGNSILATWHTDFQSKQNGIFYSYVNLDLPAATPGSYDATGDAGKLTNFVAPASQLSTLIPSATPLPANSLKTTNESNNLNNIFIVSAVLAVALCVAAFIYTRKRH
jgi:hypothetical protein